ncbi:MAG: aquaporin family protein [Chloroflexi bacterium]|nr:aquaporin family protein [Chloroflexota bacterium]
MQPWIAEIIGTAILVWLGDGVVANVLLNKSKGQNSGWIVITTGWGLAVFVGAYSVASISGAHINPAVTLGLAVSGAFPWADVPLYFVGQMIGAFIGAVLVWLQYLPHWKETEDPGLKLGVFSTAPAIRDTPANFLSEALGTFMLMFGIFVIKPAAYLGDVAGSVDLGALGLIPVAFLVWGIGLSLGGPTGYAINPARDLGPRIAHQILPIAGKGDSDWGYSWIPVIGPLVGAAVAGLLYVALGRF